MRWPRARAALAARVRALLRRAPAAALGLVEFGPEDPQLLVQYQLLENTSEMRQTIVSIESRPRQRAKITRETPPERDRPAAVARLWQHHCRSRSWHLGNNPGPEDVKRP